MSSLKGKVVVITGASAGIGAATAVKFAKHGCRLVLCGRNESALNGVVDRCVAEGISRQDVATVLGDLEEDKTVEEIITTTLSTFGAINVLFNNAGYASSDGGPLSVDGTVEGLDKMYRIHLRVPYMLIQGFVKELTKTKGVIINCSSGYSVIADPLRTAYCVMKAALDHFTKVLAIELALKGVRVNGIIPGFVKTSITRELGEVADQFWKSAESLTPLEHRLAKPEDIANIVVFLASDESTAFTGANLICDRGTTLTSRIVDFEQFK